MNANKNFAIIDNASGLIWWTGAAASPEAACAAATLETGGDVATYESTYQFDGASGYFVYEAPAGFNVDDGTDQAAIAEVSAMPLIGKYREVSAN